MTTFDWTAVVLVAISMLYVTFALTLRDWLAALGRGEAVTLLPERGGRRWPLWTQIVLTLVGLALCVPYFYYLWIPILGYMGASSLSLKISGLLVYLCGLALVLWARRTLGRNWGISTSTQVKLLDNQQLIQTGPYRFVRHPMYFGWWVCMLGLTLLYPVWAMLVLLFFSVVSFYRRARREEQALSGRFGAAWTDYRTQTRFLIPFIW